MSSDQRLTTGRATSFATFTQKPENTESFAIPIKILNTISLELSLEPIDNVTLAAVCGAMDGNIRRVESAFSVSIKRRVALLRIEGEATLAQAASGTGMRLRQAYHARAARNALVGTFRYDRSPIPSVCAARSFAVPEVTLWIVLLRFIFRKDVSVVRYAKPFHARFRKRNDLSRLL